MKSLTDVGRQTWNDVRFSLGENRLSIIAVLSDCGCNWRLEDMRVSLMAA